MMHDHATPDNPIAIIHESECIGCGKCLKVCPVDAIIGTVGKMHTVIIDECIGCNLCLPPCPTQCISIIAGPSLTDEESTRKTLKAKQRHKDRQARLKKEQVAIADSLSAKHDYITNAMKRVRKT